MDPHGDGPIARPGAAIELTDAMLRELERVTDQDSLRRVVSDVVNDLGFSHFAMITHEDLRVSRPGQIDIRCYPEAISERIILEGNFRRDPVMRGCIFADGAFLWSSLPDIIRLDKKDRASLLYGNAHGLHEGITVPCMKLGQCLGSFTVAGAVSTEMARRRLGMAQMLGIFAFQRARRLAGPREPPDQKFRLNPRPRDCVMLAGRGLSNKQIARALGLAPRTVDGYLADARRLFAVSDRTELVVAAVLHGEIGLHELR